MTAYEPTYVIVMNGSAPDTERNLTGQGKGLEMIVTNGTPCDTKLMYVVYMQNQFTGYQVQ